MLTLIADLEGVVKEEVRYQSGSKTETAMRCKVLAQAVCKHTDAYAMCDTMQMKTLECERGWFKTIPSSSL